MSGVDRVGGLNLGAGGVKTTPECQVPLRASLPALPSLATGPLPSLS